LVAQQTGATNQGGADSTYLIGSNANAYSQGSGHTTNVAAYIADAESQGSGGSADTLTDFSSYGLYVNTGASVTNAYHFWAHPEVIAGSVTNLYGVSIDTPTVSGTVTNAYAFWVGDQSGIATNPYYSWFDSRGVRRIKEDNTFNGVGQAIEALYNPQFTKYTAGTPNYERLILGEWNSNIAEIGTENGGTGSARALAFITASSTRMTIGATGLVGVATTTPWRQLSVTGTVGFDGLTGSTGAGSLCLSASKEVVYNSGSDNCLASLRALKHGIQNLDLDATTTVTKLQPVSFIYNDDTSSTTRYGFIAEDTAAVDSHLATYDQRGKLSGVDDRALLAIIVSAIQQIEKAIANLADRFTTKELTFARATGDAIDVNVLKSKEEHTQKLCVQKTDGTDVCVTGDQLAALLAGANQNVVPAASTPQPPTVSTESSTSTSTPPQLSTTSTMQ